MSVSYLHFIAYDYQQIESDPEVVQVFVKICKPKCPRTEFRQSENTAMQFIF